MSTFPQLPAAQLASPSVLSTQAYQMIGVLIACVLTLVLFSGHHLPFLFIGFSEVLSLNLPTFLKDSAGCLASKQMQAVEKAQLTYTLKRKVQRDRGEEGRIKIVPREATVEVNY